MKTYQAYNDAHSRAVFQRFKERLEPLMAEVTPDWLLHHMEIARGLTPDFRDEVTIKLVIRPIGDVRVVDPNADLLTGYKRLEQDR